ncbi:unnamed protein product [Peniophora sp. CBMAI 1063]|nr:unnamed protein product [Peniophora sp. CBMAI 1063]
MTRNLANLVDVSGLLAAKDEDASSSLVANSVKHARDCTIQDGCARASPASDNTDLQAASVHENAGAQASLAADAPEAYFRDSLGAATQSIDASSADIAKDESGTLVSAHVPVEKERGRDS